MSVDAAVPGIAEWLFDQLAERDMSQRALARAIGVNPSAVGHWVAKRSIPDPPNCRKIAEFFGVDPDFILALAGHRPEDERDELVNLDPEIRFYFLNYHRLSEPFQRLLKEQLRAYYGDIDVTPPVPQANNRGGAGSR